jgi:hypothetical protein
MDTKSRNDLKAALVIFLTVLFCLPTFFDSAAIAQDKPSDGTAAKPDPQKIKDNAKEELEKRLAKHKKAFRDPNSNATEVTQ